MAACLRYQHFLYLILFFAKIVETYTTIRHNHIIIGYCHSLLIGFAKLSILLKVSNKRCFLFIVAYLLLWLSVIIHFDRYNLCFYKYTKCGDKCKPLYLIVLHIRVVPPFFNPFEKYLLSTIDWIIGCFGMDVTECLLNR